MEVSGQLHAPAALPPGKKTLVLLQIQEQLRINTLKVVLDDQVTGDELVHVEPCYHAVTLLHVKQSL